MGAQTKRHGVAMCTALDAIRVLDAAERVELARVLLGEGEGEGLPWAGFGPDALAAFPVATVANMRRAPAGTFLLDPDTGERSSATPGDYFMYPEHETLTGAHGAPPLVLAREVTSSALVPAFAPDQTGGDAA